MNTRRKLKVKINKTRWFHVSFQFQKDQGRQLQYNSCNLRLNRELPDDEMILSELKSKFNVDNMIILSCFEVLNPNHK
jgi:hypothetical protein